MSDPSNSAPSREPLLYQRGCGWLFISAMLVASALWGSALGYFRFVIGDSDREISRLEEFVPKTGTKLIASSGELLGEFSIEQRRLLPLSEMPLHLQKAFVATEDDTFYEHRGVRWDAIINAVIYTLQTGKTRGGSGITQQVVRNIEELEVGTERTVARKIREAIVALQVDRAFTKDEILELYLNQVFLGISAYGVEAASWQYYDKSARDVTLGEAATLAGVLRLPNVNEPIHHPQNAKTRRDIVLRQMLDNGFITDQEYVAALQEDLDASVVTPEERAAREAAEAEEGRWKPNRFDAPYFAEEVRRELLRRFGEEAVFGGGLTVRTTVDMRLQRAAEEALLTALDEFDAARMEHLERQGREDTFLPVSGALVCIDNRTGYEGFVRAMVGGRDFATRKFNAATQALRQPGSSVKPYVWLAALDNGYTASTIEYDTPFERRAGSGQIWRPKNFDGEFHGPMPIRHALERSVNIISIRMVERLGMPLVRSYMEDAGITTPIDDAVGLTLALGTPETYVIDQAVAYSTFAKLGVRADPVYIELVTNRDGIVTYTYREEADRVRRVFDESLTYVMTHLLQGVCEDGNGVYPTGRRTAPLERPRGGKTGTTNESRDVWFCGFTADYTCVVWVGYDDNRPLGRGINYTGGRLACPIWTEFMVAAHEGLPPRDFDVPEGVDFYSINRKTGTRGGGYREAFLTGTAPPYYVEPEPETSEIGDPILAATESTPAPGSSPTAPAGPLQAVSSSSQLVRE